MKLSLSMEESILDEICSDLKQFANSRANNDIRAADVYYNRFHAAVGVLQAITGQIYSFLTTPDKEYYRLIRGSDVIRALKKYESRLNEPSIQYFWTGNIVFPKPASKPRIKSKAKVKRHSVATEAVMERVKPKEPVEPESYWYQKY